MFTQRQKQKNKPGFTLLEILLVVAIIAILAGIVIIAINPGKQLADGRNSQRKSDVNALLSATYQYMIDNNGTVPASVPSSATCATPATNEICKTGGTCTGLVDLAVLTTNQKYIVSVPVDPSCPASNVNGTCYFIAKNTNGRLTTCAPNAEGDAPVTPISVTR
jgi:type IV pilus assembly protein PilA